MDWIENWDLEAEWITGGAIKARAKDVCFDRAADHGQKLRVSLDPLTKTGKVSVKKEQSRIEGCVERERSQG